MNTRQRFTLALVLMAFGFLFLTGMTLVFGQSLPAERQKSREAVALTNLGFTYSKSGQNTRAADVLRRAIQLEPELAEAHYFLAATYNNMDLCTEAVEEFQAVSYT